MIPMLINACFIFLFMQKSDHLIQKLTIRLSEAEREIQRAIQ
jgi:hypothetical protein